MPILCNSWQKIENIIENCQLITQTPESKDISRRGNSRPTALMNPDAKTLAQILTNGARPRVESTVHHE